MKEDGDERVEGRVKREPKSPRRQQKFGPNTAASPVRTNNG
jgi:hypothetical protein